MQPCASLHVTFLQENGHIFEGLRTIAAYYLRADSCSICECIQTFALNDLLFSIARLECAFKKTLRSGRTSPFGEPFMLHIVARQASRSWVWDSSLVHAQCIGYLISHMMSV